MNKSDIKKVYYNGNEIDSLYWGSNLLWKREEEISPDWVIKGVWEDGRYSYQTEYNGKPYIYYNGVRYDDLQMDGNNNFYFYSDEVLKNANYMFCNLIKNGNSESYYKNYNLTSVDLSMLDFSKVTNCSSMFNGCLKLTSVDLSMLDFSKVTNCSSMFDGCVNIEHIKFPTVQFCDSNYTGGGMVGMFYDCTKLETIENYNIIITGGYNSKDFYNCKSLKNVTGTPSFNGKANGRTDLHYSPLTNDSAMVFINGLAEAETTPTIRFSDTTYDTLTEEQIALATSKGWSVVKG